MPTIIQSILYSGCFWKSSSNNFSPITIHVIYCSQVYTHLKGFGQRQAMKSVNNVKERERDSECNTSKCPKEVLAQIVCTAAEYVVYPRMSVAGIWLWVYKSVACMAYHTLPVLWVFYGSYYPLFFSFFLFHFGILHICVYFVCILYSSPEKWALHMHKFYVLHVFAYTPEKVYRYT